MTANDTIFATSSGVRPAAIAIVRLSGPDARTIAAALAGPLPPPRYAALRTLRDPANGELLDRAIVLVFDAPRTSTGEDVVELHVHGGRAVVTAVERAITTQPNARPATPGEFTRRALENGVIDLTAAEGLADLLSAETESQRRSALAMAEGGVRAAIEGWSERLIGIAARVEAQLDFSDEDDVSHEDVVAIVKDVAQVAAEIRDVLASPPTERLHDGVRVVIAGPPNSGKSTLLNAMAERDVAIVSPVSGTTRDRIEAPVVRNGMAYVLTDTAGLTDTPGNEVERIGINRAEIAMADADVVIWTADTSPPRTDSVWIHSRADCVDRETKPDGPCISVSGMTGVGLSRLWNLVEERVRFLIPREGEFAVNQRQRNLLVECLGSLERVGAVDLLIVAEELRLALKALDSVTGRSGIENILDAIFSRFCVGK